MVCCRYTIGALVLRLHHEGKRVVQRAKDKMWYLKCICSQKVLRPIIQQSTNIDVYKIKNNQKKIVMCDGSLQFNSRTP